MRTFSLPYGHDALPLTVPEDRLCQVLLPRPESAAAPAPGPELVRAAMERPIGSPRLKELAAGKKKVVILCSDHTRPVPSRVILPPMLAEIREGNPDAEITLLVATGCHRAPTREELTAKFGEEIVKREKIVIHACGRDSEMADLGTLPSGGRFLLNRTAAEADLLLAEGFIEPHFFAGFSGGRKSVLPGAASRTTVLANHCAAFIADERARTGILEGNPIHRDMVWAARRAGLAYIVNVVLNGKKEIVCAVAGDMEAAHLAGTARLSEGCRVTARPADIVVTTNGGYPLDQNVYQAVKGMTAAEAAVREGGVIIMLARSEDGHGGAQFYRDFKDNADLDALLARFLATPPEETVPDQWQSQILIRVLKKARVIYVSDLPDQMIRDFHMIPARSPQEALALADDLLGRPDGTVTVIPDGVGVIVLPE